MNLREEISKKAYELYEKSGKAGRDLENWLEAEKIVMAKYAKKEAATAVKKAEEAAGAAAKKNKKNTRMIPSKDYLNHQSNPKSLRHLHCHNPFLSCPFLLIQPCHTSLLFLPLIILGAVLPLAKRNSCPLLSFQKTDAHPFSTCG